MTINPAARLGLATTDDLLAELAARLTPQPLHTNIADGRREAHSEAADLLLRARELLTPEDLDYRTVTIERSLALVIADSPLKAELYRSPQADDDKLPPYRWRLRARNGEVVAHGEGYHNRRDARHALDLLDAFRLNPADVAR